MEAKRANADERPIGGGADEPSLRGGGSAEATFQREVEKDLRRNYVAYLAHGLLGQTGFRLLQAPTLIPAYVFHLTGSNSLVGLARACQALGMFTTPLLGASLIEHRRRVMKMVFVTGTGMRLQVLGLSLAGFFLGKQANTWAICILLGLFGFFTGMQSVTFSFLMSKVIPVERRGRLVGFRNALGGLTASSVGFLGGLMVEHNVLGNGFASVFLLAFVLTASGLLSLLIMREPSSPEVKPRAKLGSRFRELPALLRADRGFRWYMLARALGATGRMAQPYYIIYAGTQLDLSGADLGVLTTAFLLANTLSNLLWGLIADRSGFRNVLAASLMTWAASTVLFMYAGTFDLFALGFIGLGAGFGGFQMGCINLVLEFGEREDLPMRIAMAQSGEQLVSIFAPLVGALLAETASYSAMFSIAASLQAVAILVTWLRVSEPRRRDSSPVA